MDSKSTSGACQILRGILVCWSAKKQQSVAMSSAEAGYVVATGCCANILWMKSQLATSLDYNQGTYVSHPSPEAVKDDLAKIATDATLLNRTPVQKTEFPMIAYYLITRTIVDIEEIIYSDLVTKLTNKSRLKYVSYPRFILCALAELLGPEYTQDENFENLLGIMSNSNFSKDPSKVTEIELTASMIVVNNRETSVSPLPFSGKKKKGKTQTGSHSPSDEGTLKSQPLPEDKKSDPQDSKSNLQLVDMGLPSTVPDEGVGKPSLYLRG
ncbi:hypothetical protein Tco_0913652 [Tanacetum coccineum]